MTWRSIDAWELEMRRIELARGRSRRGLVTALEVRMVRYVTALPGLP